MRLLGDSVGNVYIADTGNNRVRKVATGTGVVTTVAGTGIAGYSGDNGPAASAQLSWPWALALDSAGNLYIADDGNGVVRMVAAKTGTITTVAGNPTAPALGDGGPATSAQLTAPAGLALDAAGDLYIADQYRVRKVTASTGMITTVAGDGSYGNTGDNGPATSATLSDAQGLVVDSAGNLYIADQLNSEIRKVTAATGDITTVAGADPNYSGTNASGDGGPATSARLSFPQGVAVDSAGNLYIADSNDDAVREVTASNGIINTIAGTPQRQCSSVSGDGGTAIDASICYPTGVSLDSTGNLYIAEPSADRIRKVSVAAAPPTAVTAAPAFSISAGTYASPQTVSITSATPGAEIYVSLNGAAPTTTIEGYHGPIHVTGSVKLQAVAVAPGHLPSAPISATYTLTKPPAAVVTTVAGTEVYGVSAAGALAFSAELRNPQGVALDAAGNLYSADAGNEVVWMVAAATGTISVAAGTPGTSGIPGNNGDGGPATAAFLNNPSHVAFDSAGNMFIADTYNNVVRKVAAQTGTISTYAGDGNFAPGLGDGGPATSATLATPQGLAFDSAGNLYIADSSHGEIRMVSASDSGGGRVRVVDECTKTISTLAGNGNAGESGDGGPATEAEIDPYGIAVDGAGNVYIANPLDEIRMIPAGGGVITAVAGSGYTGFGGDGGSATMAEFIMPGGLVFDKSGSLYVADTYNNRVRKVTFSGAAATPNFGLAPGTYKSVQTVAITDQTSGSAIYYTTDGSTPTAASTEYKSPITVSSTETLRAIAVATGFTVSETASATYTINIGPVSPAITWPTPAPISYGTPLSSAQLNAATTVSGSFAYSPPSGTVLNAGQQKLTATFTPADTKDYTTSSASVTLTVNPAAPAVDSVGSSLNPSMVSDQVTFTATVTSPLGTPSGTVTFLDGTTQLGSGTLTAGAATFSTSGLAAGSHAITAVYSGDPNFASMTSAPLTQVVESFSIGTSSSGSSSATASPGGQANFALTVTPPSAGSALTFSVTGLPAGATATFSPSTVAAGSGATNVTLTVSLPGTSAMIPSGSPLQRGALPIALGLILLPMSGRFRNLSLQRLRLVWVGIVIPGAATFMSGSGGGGSGSSTSTSNPQTYTLTVTASSGSLTQSTKLTLSVE